MTRTINAASFVVLTLVCGAAFADDNKSSGESNKDAQNSNESQTKYQLSPAGWVQIAVDYDQDGKFDAIETIYAYDFEKARKSSQQRASRDADKMSTSSKQKRQAKSGNANSNDNGQQSKQGGQSTEAIAGKLLQLRDESIMGMEEACVIARVRKENNMPAKVVLGPKSTVDSWGLVEGDEIKVKGRKGRINDRPMLIAKQVSWGDKTKQVNLPSSRNSKRIKAEVMNLRTTKFKGHKGQFVIAQIKSQSGEESEINLGQKSKVDQLDLSQGDQLRLIVRPAKLNGKPGMVADQIMAGGKTVDVSPPKQIARRDRDRNKNKNRQGNRATSRSDNRQAKSTQSSNSPDSTGGAALGVAVGESGEGVVIIGIHPNSPLANKGLRVGDTIKSINDQEISSSQDLVSMIGEMEPGNPVTIVTDREGETSEVDVKLASRQELMQSYR